MALNIPSGSVHEKAREAAGLLTLRTGHKVSQVSAIEEGLDKLLAGLRQSDLSAQLLRIGAETAALMGPEFSTYDYDADLYDENGLPQ